VQEFFGFRNFRQFERTRREIKLPYDLLNDIRFRQLPDARKAHLICLLLLSARMNNLLPNSPVKLERLIGATEPLDLSAFADFVDFAAVEKPSWQDRVANRRVPDSMRAAVLVRDGARCRKCRRAIKLEMDHIVPVSKGGGPKNRTFKPCAGAATGPSPGSWSPGSEDECAERNHPAASRSSWPCCSCANLSPLSQKIPSGCSRPRRYSPLRRSGAGILSRGNTGAEFSRNTKNRI
jgi:hypothetical protein